MALTQDQQKKAFLIALAVVAGSYLWYKGMVAVRQQIASKHEENEALQEKVESLKRTAARKDALERERDALTAEVSKAEKKLPKQKNLEEIIRIVTEQSQRYKIFINTFSPEAEKP